MTERNDSQHQTSNQDAHKQKTPAQPRVYEASHVHKRRVDDKGATRRFNLFGKKKQAEQGDVSERFVADNQSSEPGVVLTPDFSKRAQAGAVPSVGALGDEQVQDASGIPATSDAEGVSSAAGISDASDASNKSGVPGTSDAAGTSDASGTPGASSASDSPDATDTPDKSDASSAPETSDAASTSDASDIAATSGASATSDALDAPDTSDAQDDSQQKSFSARFAALPRQRFGMIAALAVVALIVVGLILFMWGRWYRFDDHADMQGSWYVVGTAVPVSIDESSIHLTDDVSYNYDINPQEKTINYTFGPMQGQGRYWFSDDRQYLVITDGDEFTGAGTALDDLLHMVAELPDRALGNGIRLPDGEGVIAFCRTPDEAALALQQAKAAFSAQGLKTGVERGIALVNRFAEEEEDYYYYYYEEDEAYWDDSDSQTYDSEEYESEEDAASWDDSYEEEY